MANIIAQRVGVTLHCETVRRALAARANTLMRANRDVVTRNTTAKKQKGHDYAMRFYSALAQYMMVFYLGETNFSLWYASWYG